MLAFFKLLTRLAEGAIAIPQRIVRTLLVTVVLNPRLGPLRYVVFAAAGFVVFAVTLVYVVAPVRGFVGHTFLAEKLRYDAERWLATAIYDAHGNFVGTFDPRLDSRRDVNHTGRTIEIGDYEASPDHKSIPVREVPEHYWRCLVYQEDRYIGSWLNPYGIDLLGVLKIPYSTFKRSIALRRPSFGVGGSTLPMQFARVIYKTPPSTSESALTKLKRKMREWWLAPVIYHELTLGGDDTPLKQWAANHIWLAQRTGGSPLHGVEVTSRIVFGKEAKDLTIAEQFVLASAVNKPIILLEGSDKLNEVRLDRWRYITEVRAKTCANRLIDDAEQQKQVYFELVGLAGGPPDPRVKPKVQEALEHFAPQAAKRAQANPVARANVLMPAARFGLREELKTAFGDGWREHARGVTATFDAVENLAFDRAIEATLPGLSRKLEARLGPGITLDPARIDATRQMPQVVVAAANHKGEIVRYYENYQNTPYYGSAHAVDRVTGTYDRGREGRMIASTAKMLVAIGIANERRDTTQSLYLDTQAPARGLETCQHNGNERRGRTAVVSFACSLNNPLMHRAVALGQGRVKALIDAFGFNMPPADANGEGTPPSTAAVLGQIAGAPRRVHHMAGAILASLIGEGGKPLKPPSMVKAFDFTTKASAEAHGRNASGAIVPDDIIRRDGRAMLKVLLQAPLCYQANGAVHGTLKSLSAWCAERRGDLRLHFAKTGTQVNEDPNATVDVWITGGLQFSNGAAYSYVVLVGTGTAREPWARSVHAGQVTPLLEVLLADLAGHARRHPQPKLLPAPAVVQSPARYTPASGETARPVKGVKRLNEDDRRRAFGVTF